MLQGIHSQLLSMKPCSLCRLLCMPWSIAHPGRDLMLQADFRGTALFKAVQIKTASHLWPGFHRPHMTLIDATDALKSLDVCSAACEFVI
jgi:hypothetical protein